MHRQEKEFRKLKEMEFSFFKASQRETNEDERKHAWILAALFIAGGGWTPRLAKKDRQAGFGLAPWVE